MIFPWLNNNMRCFEMPYSLFFLFLIRQLNNNMRCFEIDFIGTLYKLKEELNNNMYKC